MKQPNKLTAQQVAERFQKQAMPTIFYRLTEEICWGFFSDEHQRMHLQTVDLEHKTNKTKIHVWLENLGTRIFEVAQCPNDPKCKQAVKDLRHKLTTERDEVEIKWTDLMIEKNWIKADLQGNLVVVTAYPRSNTKFTRTVDLWQEAPGMMTDIKPGDLKQKNVKIKRDMGSLSVSALGREFVDIRLDHLLWID